MTFPLPLQHVQRGGEHVALQLGQTLFVLGANGTGKSSLMQRFSASSGGRARRISASRQTWMQSSAIEFAPSQKTQLENQFRNWDNQYQSRFMEQNAQVRPGLTIYDLIDAENVEARAIASALRSGETGLAQELAKRTAPIAKVNELFSASNLPVAIAVEGGDRLIARKHGSPPYGVAELSDGERNALLISAEVLTARPGSLLIIDEPERHLHRSIISPLLTQLFRYRDDCAFVVATHDLMLPVDNPEAQVVLVRSCVYSGQQAVSWDYDVVPANAEIDEQLKHDIVGARRRIVFTEGEESSLDKPLYGVIFPDISIRAKGTSRDVIQAVRGIRESEAVHWVKAYGIVDRDARTANEITALEQLGIYVLDFYAVEAIYYNPKVIQGVAKRNASVIGGDGDERAEQAITAGLAAVQPHLARLAVRAVERWVRKQLFSALPNSASISSGTSVEVHIETAPLLAQEVEELNTAAQNRDWTRILRTCSIKDSPAPNAIAIAVGFKNSGTYEGAVLQMLRDDPISLALVRSFFSPLTGELGVS